MVIDLDSYAVSEDAFALRDTLQRTLDTVVSVFESYGVPLPTRRYWTMGRPAEDCAQVVVSYLLMYLGSPGDQANEPRHCNSPRSAVLNISISRDVPISAAALSTEKIMTAAEWSAVDAWVLMEAVNQFDTWGNGLPGIGVIATVQAPDQGGAIQTINMNITLGVSS